MSRTIRSTRRSRFTETFDRPTRGPLWLAVVVSVVAGTLVACHVKDDETQPTNAAVVTQPDDSVPQPPIDSVTPQSSAAVNVQP